MTKYIPIVQYGNNTKMYMSSMKSMSGRRNHTKPKHMLLSHLIPNFYSTLQNSTHTFAQSLSLSDRHIGYTDTVDTVTHLLVCRDSDVIEYIASRLNEYT